MPEDHKNEAPGSADLDRDHTTGAELGTEEAQAKVDVDTAKGHSGESADPTPRENYTVAGVIAGKPTPETDPAQARLVGSNKFRHIEDAEASKEK